MKRRIALVVSAATLLVVAAPAAAASAAPAGAGSGSGKGKVTTQAVAGNVTPGAIALELERGMDGLAVTMDAGASEEKGIVVANHTDDLRLTVRLTATDATGRLAQGPGSWIAFSDDAVQLEPNSVKNIVMKIVVPHATQPGQALAHVYATVDSAVAAVDGSPRTGTAKATLPVSITVNGAATAQVAIADLHRVDQGAKHQLAIVLRNFGNQPAHIEGNVRAVAGDRPQTIPVKTDIPAARDTTVAVDWIPPPQGVPADVAVSLDYGGNDVASWSSTLGGPPTTLQPSGSTTPNSAASTGDGSSTELTTPGADASANSTSNAAAATPKQSWTDGPLLPMLIVFGLIIAGGWFFLELRASRRRDDMPMPPFVMPGWGPPPSDASGDLAKQLVRLTEIIIELTRGAPPTRASEAQARAPDADDIERIERLIATSGPDVEATWNARAGPSPGDRDPPEVARGPDTTTEVPEPPRSAPAAPGVPARPETGDDRAATGGQRSVESTRRNGDDSAATGRERSVESTRRSSGAPVADPRPAVMDRLMELDRERRRLRKWMDTEDVPGALSGPLPADDGGPGDPPGDPGVSRR